MNGLWQTLIGGLAVAAISGLTAIAYRHPAGYRRIYVPLLCVLGGVWAVWFVYRLGFTLGFSTATLETIKLNATTVTKIPNQGSPSFWFYIAPAILYAYLSILRLLPLVLRDEKSISERNEQ